jgi:nitrogenase molybdenum-iron protein alpha/beta subunit
VLRQAAEPLKGRRIALFADGAKLHGLLGLCRDVNAVPVLAGVLDGRASRMTDARSDRLEVLDDPGDGTVHRRLRDLGPAGIDLVVAPAPIATMAQRMGLRALEFGFPCRAHQALYPVPYAGYGGVRALAARMLEAAEAGR